MRTRSVAAVALAVVGFIVLALVLLAVTTYMLAFLGAATFLYAAALALIPLAIVMLGIRWIDRWEPEPRGALVFAFLWGAAASIAIALVFDLGVQLLSDLAGIGEGFETLFFSLVVQAPVVEEMAKGLGILIIFWSLRRHFDGPVDGLVYGAMVAVGFAFTENIQYFGLALAGAEGAGDVGQVFVLRGLISPFAHVMFTACTGIIIGFAARSSSKPGMLAWFVPGLIPAIVLHAFWNGATLFVRDFYSYYFTVQVPLFLVGLAIVLFLRQQEQALTRRHLAEYAAVGWFSAEEVALLSTGAGRRKGIAWARRHGLGSVYQRFTRDATRLAFARNRVVLGRERIGAHGDEAEMLAEIAAVRAALAQLPPLPRP
ncbi:MAG: PrsW family intrarane metalloprotease [Homoserinimonas sp.]|jgi:RsiW-degrading membrane proteinase PrsW (M82 family)|nr:PrsW family intrarane metalloprotease [Homoserinimonas sp.]